MLKIHLTNWSKGKRKAVFIVLSYPSCVCVRCPLVIAKLKSWDWVFVFNHSNVVSNVQFLILPILRQDYIDEFVMLNCNSFRSWVMWGRAICICLTRPDFSKLLFTSRYAIHTNQYLYYSLDTVWTTEIV